MAVKNGRWWLTQDSRQIVINTSPDHLYDLVADLPRMGEWSPECERVDWEDKTAIAGEGARFVGHNRGGPFHLLRWSRHGRVLTADPGGEFAFVTEEGGRESTVWRYRFEPVEGGTRVTESYEVRWIPAWPGSSTCRPTATASCTTPCATPSSDSKRLPKPVHRSPKQGASTVEI